MVEVKTLNYNAGLITRQQRNEFRIVRDMSKSGSQVQIKNPGGMLEDVDKRDFEYWWIALKALLSLAGFSTNQLASIYEYELSVTRTENERGVVREIAEEAFFYAHKVEHVHYQLSKGDALKNRSPVDQNFWFVVEYIEPQVKQNVQSIDRDVQGSGSWVSAEELLCDPMIQGADTIIWSHKKAVEVVRDSKKISKKISIEEIKKIV